MGPAENNKSEDWCCYHRDVTPELGQFRQRLQDKRREWREIQLTTPVPCRYCGLEDSFRKVDIFLTVGGKRLHTLTLGVTTGRVGPTVLESFNVLVSRQGAHRGCQSRSRPTLQPTGTGLIVFLPQTQPRHLAL